MISELRTHQKCAIIIGTYINAYSIYRSLRAIKYDGTIYMIDTNLDSGKCLADVVAKDAVVIKKKIKRTNEIVNIINDLIPDDAVKHIFFTSEQCIDAVKDAINKKILKNAYTPVGSKISNELIFDRYQFYNFISSIEGVSVPLTIPSTENPFAVLGNQFIVRMRRTWHETSKLPRLSIVNNETELREIEDNYLSAGYSKEMWCYQELLSIADEHNVSVCGWHDSEFQQYAVTRKLVQHPSKTGNGDVVEIVRNIPAGLVETTKKILSKLYYVGPFELEYVFDLKSNQYKVIELNPRYWMQHGLIEDLTNHALVRKNIGEKPDAEIQPAKLPYRLWINTNQAIYRLLKGQIEMLSYLNNSTRLPGFYNSLRWFPYYSRYKKQISE